MKDDFISLTGMVCLQNYKELLSLPTLCRVHSNIKRYPTLLDKISILT